MPNGSPGRSPACIEVSGLAAVVRVEAEDRVAIRGPGHQGRVLGRGVGLGGTDLEAPGDEVLTGGEDCGGGKG